MPLNVTVAQEDGLKRKLTVEVPLSEVQSTYEEVYHRLRSNIRVNGFRPGHFPRHLAEKRFQSVMAGEAMQTLVPKYFEQAVTELSLRPATEPHFDNLDIDKERPFRFDVEFEVVPAFEVLPAAEFGLTEQKAAVTDKDVDARIEELRAARAGLEDKGAEPAAKGDVVTFDFHGTLDGEDFEGGQADNQRIEVGAGQYLPDFDVEFEGVKAGEDKAFDLTFPEDYGQGALAGKTVRFRVTTRKVERKVPPALDEAFFKQFGEKVTALPELKAQLKEQLESEQGRAAMQAYQNELADQMRERYEFPVPAALTEQALHEFEHQLSHDEPETLQDPDTLAARKDEERTKIEANLRVAYVVDALAKQYEVKADPEEVRQRFFMQAYMIRQNPSELINSPFGHRMISQIEQRIVTDQTLERFAKDVLAAGGKPPARKAATKAPAKAATKDAAAEPAEAKPAKARAAKGAKGAESKAEAKGEAKPAKAESKAGAKAGKGKSRSKAP
jgi:trigger factor